MWSPCAPLEINGYSCPVCHRKLIALPQFRGVRPRFENAPGASCELRGGRCRFERPTRS